MGEYLGDASIGINRSEGGARSKQNGSFTCLTLEPYVIIREEKCIEVQALEFVRAITMLHVECRPSRSSTLLEQSCKVGEQSKLESCTWRYISHNLQFGTEETLFEYNRS